MVGSWPGKDKVPGPPRGSLGAGLVFPGAGGHVPGHLAMAAETSTAALRCLKGLANEDHLS